MVGAAVLAFGAERPQAAARLLHHQPGRPHALGARGRPRREGPGAGVLHLLSHAFFKALLFLAIGLAQRHRRRHRGGDPARRRSGVHPPRRPCRSSACCRSPACRRWSGSCSKEHVLAAAEDGTRAAASPGAWVVLVALVATVALTAAYCMRAWLVLTRLTAEEEEEIDGREEAVDALVGVRRVAGRDVRTGAARRCRPTPGSGPRGGWPRPDLRRCRRACGCSC